MRRTWWIFLAGGFLPLLMVGLYLMAFDGDADLREARSLRLQISARLLRQADNTATRRAFAGADPHYIDGQLESLELLGAEREDLKFLLAEEPTAPSRDLHGRLEFLQGNRLSFREGGVVRRCGVAETEEHLAHPVEVDLEDLERMLEAVEGDVESRPQLLITDLRLCRKKSRTDNETFLLDIHLLKREFGP